VLKQIREFDKHIAVTGFKNVKIKNVEEFLKAVNGEKPIGIDVQFFDARLVATWQHLYFATLNALTAFKNSENRSKSLAMETMMFASAQRQIRKAMDFIGIKPSSSTLALLVIGEKPEDVKKTVFVVARCVNSKPNDTVLELAQDKTATICKAFEIGDKEIETVAKKENSNRAIVDLVIERMALLSTQK
jgi:tRNA threonylcarbamoyladenosine modification (KEOPS) complex Cgi121 subunit